jgi:hypothetical protein
VARKKVTAAFGGGRLTSDGGVLLLAQAERAMGICQRLAACIADLRDPARVIHSLPDILRASVFAIACGYEDADDLDAQPDDPGFRLALGKLPGSGAGLASQPTMSRWGNAPTKRELARMMAAMIDIYCASYPAPLAAVTLDIDACAVKRAQRQCPVLRHYAQTRYGAKSWKGQRRVVARIEASTLGMDIRYSPESEVRLIAFWQKRLTEARMSSADLTHL